jgi:hypothetical protein
MILSHATADGVHAALASEFIRGCRQLVKARLQQSQKDSLANRDLVAACRTHLDEILDTFLEVGRVPG